MIFGLMSAMLLLGAALMFARWGWIESDPECYVLASIYGGGALIMLILVWSLGAHL